MKREFYRKLFHFSGLVLHPLILALGERAWILWAVLLPLVSLLELLRLRGAFPKFFRFFEPLMRPVEKERISASFYYLWGVGLSFLFFPLKSALTGLWVLALADGLAGLWGKGFLHSVVFFFTSLAILLGFDYPFSPEYLFLILLWTVIEKWSWPDDNFTLPLTVALTLSINESIFC